MENFDFKEFASFKQFVTPVLIQVIFWIGVVSCVVSGIGLMFSTSFWAGLVTLVIGPLFVRIWCELFLVMFQVEKNTRK